MPNLGLIFLTGLLTGGVTCMAVQGGLLATCVANSKTKIQDTVLFLLAKLVAYTLLGLALGGLGEVLQLSITAKIWIQVMVGIYMLGVAAAMLDVHPIFRYFLIQTPSFLGKKVRKISAPVILGLSTILIPCGTTQAMMMLAIGTGSPIFGAAIMGVFVLGTSPLFMVLGLTLSKLNGWWQEKFRKVAALIIILMGLLSLSGAMGLSGMWTKIECTLTVCNKVRGEATGQVTINFTSSGYKVDNKIIKAGSQVTLTLVNTTGAGCVQAFVMPSLGIQKVVPVGGQEVIQFTAPITPGQLSFSCGMGMYRGQLTVVN